MKNAFLLYIKNWIWNKTLKVKTCDEMFLAKKAAMVMASGDTATVGGIAAVESTGKALRLFWETKSESTKFKMWVFLLGQGPQTKHKHTISRNYIKLTSLPTFKWNFCWYL